MALNFMGYHDYDSPLYDVKSLSPSQDTVIKISIFIKIYPNNKFTHDKQ